ncbi:MAG: DUF4209 domain-containing protein [Candidatus Micrarchaeia archaeon]
MTEIECVAETLKKLDDCKLERQFPHEKERILGNAIGRLRMEKKDKEEKYLQMEWMLLNNTVGYQGMINNKWEHILKELKIGKKMDFWEYDNETIEYFKQRIQSETPNLAKARIYYYLWTEKKDLNHANAAIGAFENAMEEHCDAKEFHYRQTGIFCGRFVAAMMISLGQNDRLRDTFLPKLLKLLDNSYEEVIMRGLVEIGLNCICSLAASESKVVADAESKLVDICKQHINDTRTKSAYHFTKMWLECLEKYAKEKKDQGLLKDIHKQYLNALISEGDQKSKSPLVRTCFYQDALAYGKDTGTLDSTTEEKLKKLISDGMRDSLPEFKTVQVSLTIPTEKLDKELEWFDSLGDNGQRILKLSENLIPEPEAVQKLKESMSTGLVSLFSRVVQTDSHISKPYSTEEEKSTYDTLNAVAFLLQGNQILISRAMEKYDMKAEDFIALVDATALSEVTKEIIRRGIKRHLTKDYIDSLHLLCPQIEEILRQIVKKSGGETLNYKQKSKSINQNLLGELIRDEHVEKTIGTMACMTIEAYYSNPDHPPNLRNNISHGLAKMEDFKSTNSTITLFLVMFLIQFI